MKAQKRRPPSLQDYGSPWAIVRELEREQRRRFLLDVCASPWNAKCDRYLTRRDNGLRALWSPFNWCNPPYKRQRLWLERAAALAEQSITTFCLVLASTSAAYWRPLVWEQATCDFFEGRISFIDPITRRTLPGFDRASALVIFGPRVTPGLIRTRDAKTGELISIVESRAAARRRRAA